jgi:hypothetical protein
MEVGNEGWFGKDNVENSGENTKGVNCRKERIG